MAAVIGAGVAAAIGGLGPIGDAVRQITLPLEHEALPPDDLPALEAPAAAGQPRLLKVLVVDDNADAAEMLGMLLASHGHEVVIEHDSLRALDRARSVRPDVCLLDIGLPEMDGKELARRLRAQPETRAAVLVAVTGYGQQQDREEAFAAGFQHHLVKPVNFDHLIGVLESLRGASLSASG